MQPDPTPTARTGFESIQPVGTGSLPGLDVFFCFLFSFWGSISYPSKGYRGRSTGRKWHNFVDRLRSLVTESTECVGRFHGNASVVVVVVECLSVWRGGLSTFARVRTTTSTTITTATTKENWRRFSIRKFGTGSQCRPRLISK